MKEKEREREREEREEREREERERQRQNYPSDLVHGQTTSRNLVLWEAELARPSVAGRVAVSAFQLLT